MSQFSRRNLLKAAAGTAVLGFPAIIRAQQKEVVILGLWDQTERSRTSGRSTTAACAWRWKSAA